MEGTDVHLRLCADRFCRAPSYTYSSFWSLFLNIIVAGTDALTAPIFRDRYTNCTYVDGNLELTWLQDENLDLSFLEHIR